jgi:hypothetical protein
MGRAHTMESKHVDESLKNAEGLVEMSPEEEEASAQRAKAGDTALRARWGFFF